MDISATDFIRRATNTAEYFGFRSVDELKKLPGCQNCTKKIEHTATAQLRKHDALSDLLTSGMTTFCDAKLHELEEPVLFYSIDQVPRSGDTAVSLHIYNVEKSIAEAILIQTAKALVEDLGFANNIVRINSLGDRDSSTRYLRELNNYLRKRLDDMPEAARELMKEHALLALMYLIEKEHELAHKSPNPLEYLTDQSRKHFREIIEYLDMAGTQYEIDPKLIGHHECYSDALFALELADEAGSMLPEQPLLIRGGRYNEFVYRNTKRQIPAAGAVMVLRDKKAPQRLPRSHHDTPSVYVVQLGFGPKIKTLMLINELRKNDITVYQDLASDSLSAQLRAAEARGVEYTIIIGQKEFVENGVILRNMRTRTQEQLPTDTLISKLKRSTRVH